MSRCGRCMGFWAYDGLDPHCLNCGHRGAVSELPDVSVERVMEERMSRPVGSKNKSKRTAVVQAAPPHTNVVKAASPSLSVGHGVGTNGNPYSPGDDEMAARETWVSEHSRLRSLDEHNPLLQLLAEEWEALDAQITSLKERQEFIENLVQKCRERVGV